MLPADRQCYQSKYGVTDKNLQYVAQNYQTKSPEKAHSMSLKTLYKNVKSCIKQRL